MLNKKYNKHSNFILNHLPEGGLICILIFTCLRDFGRQKLLCICFTVYCVSLFLIRFIVKSNMRIRSDVSSFFNGFFFLIFSYLIFISQSCYLLFKTPMQIGQPQPLLSDIHEFIKCLGQSFHFAFASMTTGMFLEKGSRAYVILHLLLTNCSKHSLFYYFTAIAIGIAPISTTTWIVSVLDKNAVVYLQLLYYKVSKKQVLVILNPQNRSLIAARIIREYWEKYKIRNHRMVFCRCEKTAPDVTADTFATINEIKGIAFPKTEKDFLFSKNNAAYLLCTQDIASIYFYDTMVSLDSGDRYQNKYVISDGSEEDIKRIINFKKNRTYCKSTWDIMSQLKVEWHLGRNTNDVLLIIGKGKIKDSIINEICKTDSTRIRTVVFPSIIDEYYRLLDKRQDNVKIIDPEEYADGNVENELFAHLGHFYPEERRFVYLVSEWDEENIRMKHLIYEWIKDKSRLHNISIVLYCKDPVLKQIEQAWDRQQNNNYMQDYIGYDERTMKCTINNIWREMEGKSGETEVPARS